METVELNQPVPNFVAQATSQKDILLTALKGWKAVFYFYPKDNTPGCTIEAQDFRDAYKDFKASKTCVFGVSKDLLKSHESFKEGQQLPFELISDTDGKLCKLFDVIRAHSMHGHQVTSMERSTFLIDENGVLIKEWRKVRVNGHVEEVLEAAKQ
ncbi:peroxiredoxin [Gammaproteobacteria bacterium 45_16_T64]|nr:peroxiredoxin [Gammaproteobacteria bacterium 45_16_T64]